MIDISSFTKDIASDEDLATEIARQVEDLNDLLTLAAKRGLSASVSLQSMSMDPSGARMRPVSVSLSRPVRPKC